MGDGCVQQRSAHVYRRLELLKAIEVATSSTPRSPLTLPTRRDLFNTKGYCQVVFSLPGVSGAADVDLEVVEVREEGHATWGNRPRHPPPRESRCATWMGEHFRRGRSYAWTRRGKALRPSRCGSGRK